jgi:outer membrane protein assembly factor BamB
MKKAILLRLLIVITTILIAGVTIGSWVLTTRSTSHSLTPKLVTASPTSHSLTPKPGAASPTVQDNIYFGSSQVVYKLNGRDGRVLWKQHLTRSVPLDKRATSHFGVHVLNGVVYAFMDHDFFAFNASSGKEIWHQHIVPVGSLTTDDLRIYNEILANGIIYLQHANATISARSASTGAELWHSYILQGNFFLAHGSIYARVYSGVDLTDMLYALDAATGRVRWHATEKEDSIGYAPVPVIVANGIVYDAQNTLFAFNEQTGRLLWTRTLPHENQYFVSPLVQGGVLYVSTGAMFPMTASVSQIDYRDYFHLYAFNATTGSQLWVSPAGYTSLDWIPLSENVIIASTGNGSRAITLSAIDLQSGKPLWNLSFTNFCDSSGICYDPWTDIANHTLYIIGDSSHQLLEAFDVHTGKKLSEQPLHSPLTAYDRAGVSNGTAYVLAGPYSTNGSMNTLGKVQKTIEAFSLNNGTSWQFKPPMLKGYQDAISSLVLAP